MASITSKSIPFSTLPSVHPPPATLPAYQYTPLPTPTSIRVVSLLLHAVPEEEDGLPPLHLRLRTIDLDGLDLDGSSSVSGHSSSSSSYQALSYTWGSPLSVFPSAEARDADADLHSRPVPVLASNGGPGGLFDPSREEDLDGSGLGVLTVSRNLYDYLRALEHAWRMMALMALEDGCAGKPDVAGRIRKRPLEEWERVAVLRSTKIGVLPPRTVWIDAACINQGDVDEKSAQVGMMGRIYGAAERVVVWLGADDVFARPALALLHKLGSPAPAAAKTSAATAVAREKESGTETETRVRVDAVVARASYHTVTDRDAACAALGVPPVTSARWWAVFALLSRAWFHRAWIVQEVALAGSSDERGSSSARSSRSIVVQLGQMTFTWSLLTNAAGVLYRNGLAKDVDDWAWFEINGPSFKEPLWHEESDTGELTPIMICEDRDAADRNLFVREGSAGLLAGGGVGNIIALDSIRNGDGSRWGRGDGDGDDRSVCGFTLEETSVLHIMDKCRRTSATDPRDKVYSFLSVVARPDFAPRNPSPKYRPLVPNYRLPTARVYVEAAWSFLLATRDLALLQRTQHVQPMRSRKRRSASRHPIPSSAPPCDEEAAGDIGDGCGDGDHDPDPSLPPVEGLPSWAPDWRTSPYGAVLLRFKVGEWRACEDHRWTLAADDAPHEDDGLLYGDCLPVEGWRVDVIDAVAETRDRFSLGAAGVVAAGLPEVYGWLGKVDGKPQSRGEVFWRTLMLDTLWTQYPLDSGVHGRLFFEAIWMKEMKTAAREYYSADGIGDPEKEAEWYRFVEAGSPLFPEDFKRKIEQNYPEDDGEDDEGSVAETEPSTVDENISDALDATDDHKGIVNDGDETREGKADNKRSSAGSEIDQIEALAAEGGEDALSQIDKMMLAMWRSTANALSEPDTDGEPKTDDAGVSNDSCGASADFQPAAGSKSPSGAAEAATVASAPLDSPAPAPAPTTALSNRRNERRTRTRMPPPSEPAVAAFKSHLDRVSVLRRLFRTRGGDDGEPSKQFKQPLLTETAKGKGVEEEEEGQEQEQDEDGEVERPRPKTMLLGNGPTTARAGDEVWVLAGLEVPVILRLRAAGTAAGEDAEGEGGASARRRYEFVGEAYVHGGMHGELLWEERGGVRVERLRERILLV